MVDLLKGRTFGLLMMYIGIALCLVGGATLAAGLLNNSDSEVGLVVAGSVALALAVLFGIVGNVLYQRWRLMERQSPKK